MEAESGAGRAVKGARGGGAAYRRGFGSGFGLAPPRLLGGSGLGGGWLQGAPGLKREVLEAQI